MTHQNKTIEDTVYFWFAANDTSGSGGDGATPLYDVREAGAAAGAIPLLSGTPTLLTHANYPAGCHEIAVAATTGNGFAADDTFGVFCTLAIDSQNPSGFVGSCTLTPLAKEAKQDIIDANVDTLLARIIGTLATGTHNPATAAQIAVLSDWINGGRLDLILDIIAADTTTVIPALIATAQADLDTITGTDGVTLATLQALYAPNVVVPDPAGTAPTAVENRQEMDTNSIDLNQIGSDVAGLAGAAMRGTDGANTVVPDAAGVVPTLLNDISITKNQAGLFLFEMVLATDGRTPATGLTVTGQRVLDSGVYVNVAGTFTEISNGTYRFDYLAADSNGDVGTWKFSGAASDDTKVTFLTVA